MTAEDTNGEEKKVSRPRVRERGGRAWTVILT